MNITNPKSNLTPQPRVSYASGVANRQGVRSNKRSYAESGLAEHSYNLNLPYTCVSTAV